MRPLPPYDTLNTRNDCSARLFRCPGGTGAPSSVEGRSARGVPHSFGRAKSFQAIGLHEVPARAALPRVGTRKGMQIGVYVGFTMLCCATYFVPVF